MTIKQVTEITSDTLNYRNEWVALSGDYRRVVGHGRTGKEAADQAYEAGEEHAILIFVPDHFPDMLTY